MSYTLNSSPKLPPGANVSVWARTAFASATVSGSPPASPVFTGVMGRSSLSIPGLTADRPYVAHASVGGMDRYTEFHSDGPWRVIRKENFGLSAAATTGQYINTIAVGSVNTGPTSFLLPGSLLAEHGSKFRLRYAGFSTGAAGSDPTSTLRVSLYEVTKVVATTGSTITPGTEVAASVISGLALTPRGAVVRGESTSFTIDPSKEYSYVQELLTANLPASTSTTGIIEILAS